MSAAPEVAQSAGPDEVKLEQVRSGHRFIIFAILVNFLFIGLRQGYPLFSDLVGIAGPEDPAGDPGLHPPGRSHHAGGAQHESHQGTEGGRLQGRPARRAAPVGGRLTFQQAQGAHRARIATSSHHIRVREAHPTRADQCAARRGGGPGLMTLGCRRASAGTHVRVRRLDDGPLCANNGSSTCQIHRRKAARLTVTP
jgi:hypothetical protein